MKLNKYAKAFLKGKIISQPGEILLQNHLLEGEVLDFGCGYTKDIDLLKKKNIKITGYNFQSSKKIPKKKYDTIICFNVLDSLSYEEQMQVIMDISLLLKPTGKAYYSVKRNIKHLKTNSNKYSPNRSYISNIELPFKSFITTKSFEIYEYQHYNVINFGNKKVSPFFNITKKSELIVESPNAFSFYDLFAVNPGHALVIPKRVVPNYFKLTKNEQIECWAMVNKVKNIIEKRYKPDGFNIGVNVNYAAGQTIPHVHIHVIPRYLGDVEKPRGGVRHVIPSRGDYKI